MSKKTKVEAPKFKKVVKYLKFMHCTHGFKVLPKKKSKKKLLLQVTVQVMMFLYALITFFCGMKTTSSNDKLQRMMCNAALSLFIIIFVSESIFMSKRETLIEILNWCQKVDSKIYSHCKTPPDWFGKTRLKNQKILKSYFQFFTAYVLVLFFIICPLRSIVVGHPALIADYNLKGYEERDHPIVFCCEFIIFLVGGIGWAHLVIFSLSFFIIFTNYIIAQLELIENFVQGLLVQDYQRVILQLKEITELHIEVLQIIDKLDKVFKFTVKAHEMFLYFSIALALFGREAEFPAVITLPFALIAFIGFYSLTIERIIDAEQSIRDAYYGLEWIGTSVKVQKLILLAMQQPKYISFGAVFGKDQISLIRFTETVRRAYDFGLMLLNLTKHK